MDPSLLPVPYSTLSYSPRAIYFLFSRPDDTTPRTLPSSIIMSHSRIGDLAPSPSSSSSSPSSFPHDTISKLNQSHTQRQLHKTSPSVKCFGFRSFSFSYAVTTVRRILSLQLITCCEKDVSWTSIITAAMSVAPACTSTVPYGEKKKKEKPGERG
ncbi:hypothetical protein B9Z19DRAFT_1074512 [Tuber borchii]|uniref:Uncharacterized protein n=1 Tax=Tuber borchii TaxID=42251 RepID=A0A2T7A421_TUBBO|nr:hypothetical protein B9Z19DRAFT_1074512 [Tuber borchii]